MGDMIRHMTHAKNRKRRRERERDEMSLSAFDY